jgi:cytochrome c
MARDFRRMDRTMPDTMTLTKSVAALCGALLVFLLFGWLSEAIYHGGHGAKGEQAQAYAVDTGAEEAPAEAASAEPAVPFEELLAAADPAAGERLWRQCQACHKLDGTDGTGPHLNGVVGRAKASVEGFKYSDALLAMAGDVWSPENLSAFLENPKAYAPGTRMSYNGMARPEDRAALIAYLATTGG